MMVTSCAAGTAGGADFFMTSPFDLVADKFAKIRLDHVGSPPLFHRGSRNGEGPFIQTDTASSVGMRLTEAMVEPVSICQT